MNLQVLWALTGILSVVFVNADVCDNQYTQHAALQRCFDDEGIDYAIPLATEQLKDVVLDTGAVCNDSAAFIRSGLCASNISRSCAPKEVALLVPTSTEYTKSINYLCSHLTELKPDCIQSHMDDVKACALKEVLKNSTDAPDFSKDYTKALCMTFTISSVCANYHLRDCGLRSRLVYRTYNEYILPDACRDPSTIIVTVLLCSLNISLCYVCDNVYSEHAAKQRCFDDRGIDIALPLPGHQISISDDKPKDFNLMCNNSDVYAEALVCADNITRSCSTDESTKLLPSQKLQAESVSYLCSHHQDLDMDCIRRHTWDISNCTKLEVAKNDYNIQEYGNDTLAVVCLVHAITNNCANYNLRVCGFKTRVTYDRYNRFLNPEGCNEPHPLVG